MSDSSTSCSARPTVPSFRLPRDVWSPDCFRFVKGPRLLATKPGLKSIHQPKLTDSQHHLADRTEINFSESYAHRRHERSGNSCNELAFTDGPFENGFKRQNDVTARSSSNPWPVQHVDRDRVRRRVAQGLAARNRVGRVADRHCARGLEAMSDNRGDSPLSEETEPIIRRKHRELSEESEFLAIRVRLWIASHSS